MKDGIEYAKAKKREEEARKRADQDTTEYYQKRQIPIVQTSKGVRDYGAHLTPQQKEQEQKEWLRYLFTWDNTQKKKDKQPSKESSTNETRLDPKESAILKFLRNKSYTDFLEIAMACGGLHAEKTRILCDRLVSEKKLVKHELDERMYKWNN